MAQYRKKPVTIEAFQLKDGQDGADAAPEWYADAVWRGDVNHSAGPDYVTIKTLEGVMRAEIGDWVIKGVKGELYPCKPDIFAATYDPV